MERDGTLCMDGCTSLRSADSKEVRRSDIQKGGALEEVRRSVYYVRRDFRGGTEVRH